MRFSQPYPAWRYHATEVARFVQNADEDAQLGPGWFDQPRSLKLRAAIDDTPLEPSPPVHVEQPIVEEPPGLEVEPDPEPDPTPEPKPAPAPRHRGARGK
jgi:hypothetical protein